MNIPITFEYNGQAYTGEFKSVSGGGSTSLLFLMINNFFYGQLFYTQYGWTFASNKDHFKGMDEYFGNYVSGWLDGQ